MLEGLGSKQSPTILDIDGYPTQVHADGACLEYAVHHQCTTAGEFIAQQAAVMYDLERRFGFPFEPEDWYDLREWPHLNPANTPYLWAQVNTFGCSKDRGMFGYEREVPMRVLKSPVRESGVHFHANLKPEHCNVDGCTMIAKALVKDAGIPHVWTHPTAKPWYRKPGVFRAKPYGIEYRSLGASMLSDKNRFELVVQLMFAFFEDYWRS